MEDLRCIIICIAAIVDVLGVVSDDGKYTFFFIVNVLGVDSGNGSFTLYCTCKRKGCFIGQWRIYGVCLC